MENMTTEKWDYNTLVKGDYSKVRLQHIGKVWLRKSVTKEHG